MATETPAEAPVKTPGITPEETPGPERHYQPEKLCPDQRKDGAWPCIPLP